MFYVFPNRMPTLKWNIFPNIFQNMLCTKNIFCDIFANIFQMLKYILKFLCVEKNILCIVYNELYF